ncbi:MAG: hypothetical protein HY647_06460, partial [Acidobacteria bacterium]|nr:hypothetical protein [Acidobacteriota bacterium]
MLNPRPLRRSPASLPGRIRQATGFVLLAAFFWTGCRQAELDTSASTLHQYAFVTNGRSDSVTVVDLRNFRVRAVIPVGKDPTGIKASPIRNEIYVVNTASGTLSFLNAETLRVDFTLPVG